MFSARERDDLRDRLIAAARDDDRITAAAVVGSSACDAEDAWSDIDLALRLSDGLEPDDVAGDWTTRMYESAGAVDHLDVWSGTTLFRVFLLASTLQALYMINGMRDQAVALACLRHDLPAHEGRGVDDLPGSLRLRIAETVVRELGAGELRRAFAASVSVLLEQAQEIDADRERRLRAAVWELARV